jgi:hypothetical protein
LGMMAVILTQNNTFSHFHDIIFGCLIFPHDKTC